MRIASGLTLVLLVAFPLLSSGEIYRWVDAEGRVHFTQDLSQVPPAKRGEAEVDPVTSPSDRLQTYPSSERSVGETRSERSRPGKLLRLPFVKRGNMMIVEVTLNDRVTAPFVVDTGASDVSIPTELANQLGIRVGPDTPYRRYTTANGIIAKPVITLESVQAGEARLEQVTASISASMQIGLLGGAFFNNFTLQIDPAASALTLVRNDRVRAGRSENEWRQRFQRARYDLARLEQYLEENYLTSERRVAELQAKRAEMERRLESLEEEANRADVPQAWRD
jgi:clan AA aspartic protease (TIGR02281 family)